MRADICRMTDEDRQLLDQRAERLELANSEAIPAFLRLDAGSPPRTHTLGRPLQPGSQGPEHYRDVREEQGWHRPAGREGSANQGGKRAGAYSGFRRGNQGNGSGGP